MTNTTISPKQVKWITILIALTLSRFSVVSFFPGLEMFGGPEPNEWLRPWTKGYHFRIISTTDGIFSF